MNGNGTNLRQKLVAMFSFKCSKVRSNWVGLLHGSFCGLELVYDRNQYIFWFWSHIESETKIGWYFQADTVRNGYRNQISKEESTYQYFFSIIKGPFKPNLLENIKDFYIVFEDLCSISSFWKVIPRKEVEKHDFSPCNFGKKIDSDTEIGNFR